MTFKYTKGDGKVSNRTLVVQNMPTECISGTDVTSLSMEDQALYAEELNRIKTEYMEKMLNLNSRYDLNHSYRQFKPAQMSEVLTEEI